jgi:hypothetical protein
MAQAPFVHVARGKWSVARDGGLAPDTTGSLIVDEPRANGPLCAALVDQAPGGTGPKNFSKIFPSRLDVSLVNPLAL